MQANGSLLNEQQSIATKLQARTEVAYTLKLLASVPNSLVTGISSDAEDNTEYLSRKTISLALNGWDSTSYSAPLLQRQNLDGGFGGSNGYTSNLNDTAWTVLALAQTNKGASESANLARAYLQSLIQPDGAMPGRNDINRIHSSALALLALQTTPDTSNANAVKGLATWLMQQQGADGSWLGNTYLSAFALAAISPVTADITVRGNARTYLLAKQSSDGSWDTDPFLTALALRAVSGQTAPASSGGKLQGTVVDTSTNAPLAGVTVAITGPTAVTVSTDAAGSFSVTGLTAGSYTASFSRSGYSTASRSYTLNANQTTDAGMVALTQLASTGIIRGQVTAATTGLPLPGAAVALSGAATMNTTTDAAGRYEFIIPSAGAFTISASLAGYQAAAGNGTLSAGQTVIFSPQLYTTSETAPNTIRYTGSVTSTSGAPLAGVAIQINGSSSASATTNAAGQFDVTLSGGSYAATFSLSGYSSVTQTFVASGGTTVNAGVVKLSPAASSTTVKGKVTNAANAGIAGATVQVVGTMTMVTTAADGSYTLNNVAGTSFTIRASATGYNSQTVTLQIGAPTEVQQDFTLASQSSGTFAIGNLTVAPSSVGSNADVTVTTAITNTGTEEGSAVVQLQVLDADQKIIGSGTVYDENGNLIGQINLAANQSQAIKLVWNSAQFAAGAYTLNVRLVAPGSIQSTNPQGDLLLEKTASVAVTGQAHFTGTITANPPVLQAGTNTPVKLSATLQNNGNAEIAAQSFTLKVINTKDASVAATQQVQGTAMPINGLQSLTFADWTPAAGGNYRLELTAADASLGQVSSSLYVGDAAKASYTTDKLVVSTGTQMVRGTIKVSGQDVSTGTISDPLAPVIKSAIKKAMDYNYKNAAQVTNQQNCYACHVQAQAIVGGELTRKFIDYDQYGAQRDILMKMMGRSQYDDGSFGRNVGLERTGSMMAAWTFNSFHEQDEVRSTLAKTLDYLTKAQNADGGWPTDEAHRGWARTATTTTAFNVKNFVDARQNMSTTPDQIAFSTFTSKVWATSGINTPHHLVTDSEANVYVTNYDGGNVLKINPDGSTQPYITGISKPAATLFGPDGLAYVAADSGLYRRNADGSVTKISPLAMAGLAIGPDNNLYGASFSANKVYRITLNGDISVYIDGKGLNGPAGVAFDADGNMLVVNYYGAKVMRFRPDLSAENWIPIGGARYIVPYQDGWLISTNSGIYFYDKFGSLRSIAGGTIYGVATLQDGTVLGGYRWTQSVNKLTPTYLTMTDLSARMNVGIQKGTDWLLNDSNIDMGSNLSLAHWLIGLNAAKQHYRGQPLEATLQAKMETVGALLRSRVRADGGWGLTPNHASDSLATAHVGIALDTLNPSPSDPIVQNAVKWLLSRQQADGTWRSENNIMGTPFAATTWVSIWLPILLDRLGGIDTDLTVTFPANVKMANTDLAPTTSTTNSDGTTTVKWSLTGVTAAGRSINYDLTLLDMQQDEARAVSTDAHLTFKNSFTNGTVDAPIDIPRVTASAFLGLGVATDKPSYGANVPLVATGQVTNTGADLSAGSVKYEIYAPDNTLVATLGTVPFSGLANGASINLPMNWNTGKTLAGTSYYLLGTLYDSGNRFVGTAKAGFDIVGGVSGDVTAKIGTDKQSYLPSEVVQVSERVTNVAANAVLSDLRVRTQVFGPGGGLFYTTSETLPQLAAGALKDYSYSVPLAFTAPGQYSATLVVSDAAGTPLAQTSASFTVASTAATGSGLTGTIAALPKQVPQGEPVALAYSATNGGNSPLASLPLKVAIIDPAAQQVLAEFPTTQNLVVGTPYNAGVDWTPTGPAGTNYVAVLSATIGEKTLTLAQDSFTVTVAPIKLDVKQVILNNSRVLVLLACNDGENDAPAKDGTPAACLAQRSQIVDQALTSLNVPHWITTTATDFKRALRSGYYNTYWISGKVDKLHDSLAAEIREAAFSGDGVIVDGAHDQRNKTLDAAAGLTWKGKIGETDLAADIAEGLYAAQRLATVGRSDRFELNGAVQQAALTGSKQADAYGPAILTNGYGAGHVVTYAFDLPYSIKVQSAWQDNLGKSLQHVLPAQAATSNAGAILPVKTTVTNLAKAVDVNVKSSLPASVAYIASNPTGTYAAAANTVDWTFALAEGQAQDLFLTLRLLSSASDTSLETKVATVKNGTATPYGDPLTLPIKAESAGTISAEAITSLKALQLAQNKDQKLRDSLVGQVQGAMSSYQLNTAAGYDAAIGQLISVIDQLPNLPVDTRTIRDGLDKLVKEAQWRWSQLPK